MGSETAKEGFENENAIVAKFLDWEQDVDAQMPQFKINPTELFDV